MSLLTRDYLMQNKWLALLGALCGIGVAVLFGFGSRQNGFMLVWLCILPFISCPLTLKTPIGRLWWGAYGGLVVSLVAIYFVRLPHPLAWVCLIACAACGVLTVCLRRSPPVESVS